MAKEKLLDKIDATYLSTLCNALGGEDNIELLTHCLTRLRIVVKDATKIDEASIKKMDGVKGTFTASGQFQIVFGTDVAKIYDKFVAQFKIKRSSKEEIKSVINSRESWFKKVLNYMSDIFIPIVPVLVSGGIILGIRNIFEANFNESYFIGFAADGTPILGWSMVGLSTFINGLNAFLWIPAQVCFWWLPVHICWSIFRKMGADEILGIIVGLSLLVSPLLNVYEVFNTSGLQSIWIWDIVKSLEEAGKDVAFDWGFMRYPWKIAYTAQVIPAIGVGVVGAYLNLWIKKVSPNVINQISVPTVTLLGSYVAGMFIIGPVGYVMGSAVGLGFQWALNNYIAKYFFAAIIGGLHAGLVITGMHHLLNAIMIQNVAQYGGDFIFMWICAQAIGQGSAVLGWMILNRKDPKAKEVGSSAVVAAYLGVTEPALYGVNVKYLFPFIAGSISAACSLTICVISGVTAQAIGNGSWLGILSIQVNSKMEGVKTFPGTGYLWFMIANVSNAALAIGLTMVFGKMPVFKKFDPDYIPTAEEAKKIEAKNAAKLAAKSAKHAKVSA
ncbi:PTS system trehalose-specific IIBC component [Spiroplasma clarkii]|uniref:PTS system, trehalose-specific IIB component n=1 Tax=Spiroplasma clarkii TaxID=2139 RepID=A0A1Y0L2D3_9MOLU|nr:PTS transporter subunit EIIC [Spiroplasma clarkii]ARU92171.1 PTS system trehalose-specific IIBC component [Spiroplasma clarkii]ATX71502.1 PTS system, trehalose-specific IIB component [Spiroplasma clarkii]